MLCKVVGDKLYKGLGDMLCKRLGETLYQNFTQALSRIQESLNLSQLPSPDEGLVLFQIIKAKIRILIIF